MTTHKRAPAEAEIAYDVRGPLPTVDGRPPLVMIGQPMTASGFETLASHFPDRTVVTYDPRGLGRSIRKDGRVDNAPTVQADDVHDVIEALGAGPVEMFASSGGPGARPAPESPWARGRWTLSPDAPRPPPPSCSVSRRPCSRATTAASSAASPDTPVNPNPSRASYARYSTILARRVLTRRADARGCRSRRATRASDPRVARRWGSRCSSSARSSCRPARRTRARSVAADRARRPRP